MLRVWWNQSGIVNYKLLKPGKTINAQCYYQQMTHLNHGLIKKREKTWQSDFVTRHCPVWLIKTSKRHLEIAWMGHPFTPAVILWPGGIWLSPLLINGICAFRAVLQQFRRSMKMSQRMFCGKTKTVFLVIYS
jgi:Transposase.